MATQTIVPTPMVSTGVAQESTIASLTGSPVVFAPVGNKCFITIGSASGTVNLVATCVSPCDMPLCCNQGSGAGVPNDAGLHKFVMTVVSTGTYVEKTFVIPYIDHFVDPTTGLITLTPDAGMTSNGKLGIFQMP